MAVTLTGNSYVSWGVPTFLSGLTAYSIAFTIRVAGTIQTGAAGYMLMSQFGDIQAEQRGFEVRLLDTGDLGCLHASNGTGTYWGDQTTTDPITINALVRVACQFVISGGSSTVRIWTNGVEQSDTTWVHESPSTIGAPTAQLTVGACPNFGTGVVPAVDGTYAEVALWNHAVPDWVAAGYGKGMSPDNYRIGGLFYAKTANTSADGLIDAWGGLAGTNSGGTTAAHPPMYYPG